MLRRCLAIALLLSVSVGTPATADSGVPISPSSRADEDPRGGGSTGVTARKNGRVDLVATAGGSGTTDPGDQLPPGTVICMSEIEEQPEERVVDIKRKEITVDANNQEHTRLVYDHTEQQTIHSCGGQVIGIVRKCLRGNCPPQPSLPPSSARVSIRSIVRTAAMRGSFQLPEPDAKWVPEPVRDAPLVGMPFFYGVSAEQWAQVIKRSLTVCTFGAYVQCATIALKATIVGVAFDPLNSLRREPGIRTTCKRPIPKVRSGDDAQREGRDCAVVFQDSGVYDIRLGLDYRITATVTKSIDDFVRVTTNEPIDVTVWNTHSLIIKQFQPVLE
jgi:hypothetical protein